MADLHLRQGKNCDRTRDIENKCDLNEIVSMLTPQRLKKYFQRTGPANSSLALSLYCWNHEIGAAFNVTLQQFEICLRNRISKVLECSFGAEWFLCSRLWGYNDGLRGMMKRSLDKARENRNGFAPGQHDFIAATSMSLWRELCKLEYAGLFWARRLQCAFPNSPPVKDIRKNLETIHATVHRLVKLRNRIAHHEPILGSHAEKLGEMLVTRHKEMYILLSWMSPNLVHWISARDTFPNVMAACPVSLELDITKPV